MVKSKIKKSKRTLKRSKSGKKNRKGARTRQSLIERMRRTRQRRTATIAPTTTRRREPGRFRRALNATRRATRRFIQGCAIGFNCPTRRRRTRNRNSTVNPVADDA